MQAGFSNHSFSHTVSPQHQEALRREGFTVMYLTESCQFIPRSSLRKSLPLTVCEDFSFDQFLPQVALRDDPVPLLAHQLCCAQGLGIQVGKDVLCYVIQTLGCKQTTTKE